MYEDTLRSQYTIGVPLKFGTIIICKLDCTGRPEKLNLGSIELKGLGNGFGTASYNVEP
jgi:hypothetical protein